MMRYFLFYLLFSLALPVQAEVVITPSEVYAQVLLIEKETQLIKQFLKVELQPPPVIKLMADIKPRHVWQKNYMLQMKLMMFRRKYHLGGFAPVGIEPVENIDPSFPWAQTVRTLSEIRIIRKLLDIPGEVGAAPVVKDKKPVDVFNKLAEVEAQWDAIIGKGFDSSYVFDEVLRLNEDVNSILRQLNIFDNATPPAKNLKDTSRESLEQAFLVLAQVQRLQKLAGLPTTDFSQLRKTETATPDDTFNLVCLVLAELQQVKARIGLLHVITPAAIYHEGKKTPDVRQFLGYVANKLALIEHL